MVGVIAPFEWVAFKLPSENVKVLQVIPDTSVSLGKYGAFPSNLIIGRPFHLTFEIQDKREGEDFCRLRVVPAQELRTDDSSPDTRARDASVDDSGAGPADEISLVDRESGSVVARASRKLIDENARQLLTTAEIEELKRDAKTLAGKEIVDKLLASHQALDEKTEYSLEKYKLLKTRKYVRRFSVRPLDTPMLNQWLLEEKDAQKILEMREEMVALLGCWANVHHSTPGPNSGNTVATNLPDAIDAPSLTGGRWLVVDDTCGLLVAAMAERMGILYPREMAPPGQRSAAGETSSAVHGAGAGPKRLSACGEGDVDGCEEGIPRAGPSTDAAGVGSGQGKGNTQSGMSGGDSKVPICQAVVEDAKSVAGQKAKSQSRHYERHDLQIPYAGDNTITILHSNSQPNLSFLKHYEFDMTNPNPPFATHPLHSHLTWLNWLQLLAPEEDPIYVNQPLEIPPEELGTWKANRRGIYHRKRRRWARTRFIVDSTRAGGFGGLVVASTMDPISILRHAVPLLSPGAPIAIYCQNVEPLVKLADCYSVARRAAWATTPPPEAVGLSEAELEKWSGSEDFPLNPSLLLGASIQASRVRKWQVLPGRTHPMMTGRGGAEGYIFTAWKALPASGRVEARGKYKRRKVAS